MSQGAKNLISLADRTPAERSEIARAGGKARAAREKQAKAAREVAYDLMLRPLPEDVRPFIDDTAILIGDADAPVAARIVAAQVRKALSGDLPAAKWLVELTCGFDADALEQANMTRRFTREVIESTFAE